MFLLFSAILLANASVISNSTTTIEGEGSAHTFVQTTVDGNTTTVESNNPGSIHVEKTDTGETVTSDNPVTVTHKTDAIKIPAPSLFIHEVPKESSITAHQPKNPPNWISFLQSLWDHVKHTIIVDLLTRK